MTWNNIRIAHSDACQQYDHLGQHKKYWNYNRDVQLMSTARRWRAWQEKTPWQRGQIEGAPGEVYDPMSQIILWQNGPYYRAWLGILIFGSDFWDPHWKRNSDSVFDSEDSGRFFFWNSDVWRVRKSESRIAIFRIPVICLHRNSVHLIVANLYWLQSMYNDLILMVHKLVAPLQHQTAADQHHVIAVGQSALPTLWGLGRSSTGRRNSVGFW